MPKKRAVFLDRDGTLIVERGYLSDPAGVELERLAAPSLARLQKAGWLLVLVTNQSGIARGYFSEQQAHRVNEAVATLLAAQGIMIDGVYICPHGPGDGCECRKPAPGLLLNASRDLNIDLVHSFMIGDKRSDLEAACGAGAKGMLVTTGYGETDRDWAAVSGYPVVETLADAADLILGLGRLR
ncbi:HAD family hydrolase [Sphingobium amiense]|uniref:D,D-heptose 1,7-bisphosphate phosphatase n=1 Tax=Sphingobium amiense TaxID=135719 RepID=A0A494VYA7_9SPHN|nr:HAD family hydrolase [Sphingobium amiense]BBD97383.1 HAD family hydrolase [Sphingobium amiense]